MHSLPSASTILHFHLNAQDPVQSPGDQNEMGAPVATERLVRRILSHTSDLFGIPIASITG